MKRLYNSLTPKAFATALAVLSLMGALFAAPLYQQAAKDYHPLAYAAESSQASNPADSEEAANSSGQSDSGEAQAPTARKYDDLREQNATTVEENDDRPDEVVGKIWLGTIAIAGILLLAAIFIVLFHRIYKNIYDMNTKFR